MILSLGYLILRQVFQLVILVAGDERADAVEVLVLRHQVAVLRRQVWRLDLEPADRVVLAGLPRLLPRVGWAALFVTPAPRLRVALRSRAFNDSIMLVPGMKSGGGPRGVPLVRQVDVGHTV